MNTSTWPILFWFALLAPSEPPSPTPAIADQIPKNSTPDANSEPTTNDDQADQQPAPFDQNKSKPNDRPHRKQAKQKDTEPSSNWWVEFLTLRNAIITLLFTFMLTVVTAGQWWLMRKQTQYMREGLALTKDAADAAKKSADVAEQTMQQMLLEQRPWIGSIDAVIQKPEANRSIKYLVRVVNTGKLPAHIHTMAINTVGVGGQTKFDDITSDGWEWIRNEIEAATKSAKRYGCAFAIAPGGKQDIPPPEQVTFSAEAIDAIEKTTSTIFLIAQFWYTDREPGPDSRFVFIYQPDETKCLGIGLFDFMR